MKRVLITGITGYIGSHLARKLLPEYKVYGLVREPLHLEYLADIQSEIHFLFYDGTYESMLSALQVSQPNLVYHLAAYYTGKHGADDTPKLVSSNIVLGAYLLEAMAECGSSVLIYASTVMAHYKGETYSPLNLYAATKQAFSDLLVYYTEAGLLRVATLVLSDTYGPADHRPKVLNLVQNAAQKGEYLALSDGSQDYDLVYIDDVVQAFLSLGNQLLQQEMWKNEIFQIYTSEVCSLRQTIETMLAVNHLTLNATWGQYPPSGREIHKAIRLYPLPSNWKPQISLEEGLKAMGCQQK